MATIYELIPDHELLLSLEPEELAGVVLEYLNWPNMPGQLNRYNFGLPRTVEGYPHAVQGEIRRALMEAWVWLEREGLLAPVPGDSGNYFFITRRGLRVKNATDLEAYRQANLLPKQLLHPTIAEEVWLSFSRGNYATAVLLAFKEMEVAVRNATGYSDYYGIDLMRQAFHPERGILTDMTQPPAEREATAHLFAGAIGLYKNPHSHRNIPIAAEEAAEMIIIASHLLRIIDSRIPSNAP